MHTLLFLRSPSTVFEMSSSEINRAQALSINAKRPNPSLAGASPPRAHTAQLNGTIAGMEEDSKYKSDDMFVLMPENEAWNEVCMPQHA